jgi:hypothetical protein
MAFDEQSQKAKISNQRPNCRVENFAVSFNGLKDFYRAVQILNRELGHGNWSTQGRPVRKLRRLALYNAFVPSNSKRYEDVVFSVTVTSSVIVSRIMLELFDDK